jgi:hypothetical protein
MLHLRRFPVISHMRTNFAECLGNPIDALGAASNIFKGAAVVRVSRFEEEDIGIGNCYRSH